ncbi:hydrogenase maturation nickel metallochaperone HypA [Mesobacillus subterraneus]|uniref:hydrogenase maturation nickel metallochaperone HypA/HybF n=1 Tax=Mesobacillus subterraneus TaxID=285983 RepID=UPI002041F7DF|nr:hydrogenase maturation nickel metallochaperone HypA [Mesobacillus subterraneus]MCM3682409.1 hydrogenase maturation nickel metallochaperone HypA [Mesobacillus subterraneus]
MHEMALMGEVIDIIKEDAASKRIIKIDMVELLVGEISNAMPDALKMAFEVYKEQNAYFFEKNARIFIQIEKALAECILCSKSYVPDNNRISFCPVCGLPSGKIISGESFQILSYEGSGDADESNVAHRCADQ